MIYSYSELKGKIKVGDKVRAVKGKYNLCEELHDDGSNEQEITAVVKDRFWINGCSHGFTNDSCYLEIIEPNQPTMNNEREEITWENLRENDFVKNEYGGTHKILARISDIVFLSVSSNLSDKWETCANNSVIYIEELKRAGYTITQPEKPKTPRKVTLAEIAEKFGEEVEVVE